MRCRNLVARQDARNAFAAKDSSDLAARIVMRKKLPMRLEHQLMTDVEAWLPDHRESSGITPRWTFWASVAE